MNRFLCAALIVFASMLMLSCSGGDEPVDPPGTLTLNMLDEDNGKTLLGDSDVYIDRAYNFHGPSCLIAQLGRINGLVKLSDPSLDGTAEKVAVQAGNGYQIFRKAAPRWFPSGKAALSTIADYYNVLAVSPLVKEDAVIGATVKFKLEKVPGNGLPEYDKFIGSLGYSGDEIRLKLPTADFEYDLSSGRNEITVTNQNKTLCLRLTEWVQKDYFHLYIQIGGSYTYVYGIVE